MDFLEKGYVSVTRWADVEAKKKGRDFNPRRLSLLDGVSERILGLLDFLGSFSQKPVDE